ncbi:hypothetical protein H9L19_02260 [Weissella diestrammenae]|uniref:Carbohydrate kinase FGGY N-terminal domain-containing protein n=1 Tax=Weissella diestrammenae TaxID=1162633 RepID=A0A7G9T6I7_9LACO|nr:FGGY family carbohydrate kinase [Weissella diestrammenae]MCM0583232.1 hypothetical protein [Weissella diestrammenae]QNN75712.1 hypothetical protein H9L19_02260 [Weissella diestrammenae]
MKYKFELTITSSAINTKIIDENGNAKLQERRFSDDTRAHLQSLDVVHAANVLEQMLRELIESLPRNSEISDIKIHESFDAWVFMDENDNILLKEYLNVTEADKLQGYLKALKLNGVIAQLESKSGLMISTETPLILALWFKNERPELVPVWRRMSSLHEYFYRIWTGKNQISIHLAARTGMYDLANNCWNLQALALIGITPDYLPEVVAADHLESYLLPEAIERIGLSKHTKIYW